MKNREIAQVLNKIADIMEIQGIDWKPRAYRNAARKIDNMNENVEDIYKKEGKEGLENISAIGEALAQHIADYIEKGKVKKWTKLRKSTKKDIYKLIKIEGLGPKKVKKLSQELNINDLASLKKAVKNHKIRELEGFGKKSEENIENSIKQYEESNERMHIGKAWEIAQETISYLKNNADIEKTDYAGSLRRMKETIGDVDILVVSNNPKKLMNTFVEMDNVTRILVKGKTKTSVILKSGTQVDVRTIKNESYGSALQYFTGSKSHNIQIRKIANKNNYKLSEYGLFNKKNKKIAGKNEKEIYNKLGLDWIPPEMRENKGEIEIAKQGKIPNLVQLKNIKGDLQMHTKYSDGYNSIKEMIKTAEKRKYEYIAITDHSVSEKIAKGMSIKKMKKQWKEIDKIAKNSKIKIIKSAEVDILPDGSLDYSDDILKELDMVLIAIHSRFKSTKKEMTNRILKALDNKYVNILGHPTGRMIHKRQGYNADFKKIFKKCADNNIALEINCDPARLDLNDKMIMEAKKFNVKFSLGTDAHNKKSLENIRFGIGQARRGWLEKKDIINTKTYEELVKYFKK